MSVSFQLCSDIFQECVNLVNLAMLYRPHDHCRLSLPPRVPRLIAVEFENTADRPRFIRENLNNCPWLSERLGKISHIRSPWALGRLPPGSIVKYLPGPTARRPVIRTSGAVGIQKFLYRTIRKLSNLRNLGRGSIENDDFLIKSGSRIH